MAEFYTVRELAARLKITRQTVMNWARPALGLLPPPVRLGRVVRFPKDATEQYLRTLSGSYATSGEEE